MLKFNQTPKRLLRLLWAKASDQKALATPSTFSQNGQKSIAKTNPAEFCWSNAYRHQHPLKTAGVTTAVAGRYLYGAVFVYAFYHKASHKWLWTNTLQQHFRNRLADLDPNSFQAKYLKYFGIPCYGPVAWVVTVSQLSISLSMLLGVGVRSNAALALFLLLNFVGGGYSNKSIAPFVIYSLVLMGLPTGQWLGLDKKLHEKYPELVWFK
jgi:thiosulfate dehydrogenase [quinone] large subunit